MKHNGKENTAKINLYDEAWFPKISHLTNTLNDTEKRAIEVMVAKSPSDTWESTAKKIGITGRQLFNIRQNEKVQQACYIITKEVFKSDVPDVLKKFTEKAKNGDLGAIKLFLDVAGELHEKEGQQQSSYPDLTQSAMETIEKAKKLLEKDPKEMANNELTEELMSRMSFRQG